MSTFTLKLKKVDPVKYAVITGILTALMSLVVFVPFMLLFSAAGFASEDVGAGAALFGGGIFMVIFLPIVYGILGFIVGLITTMLLNFVLKKTGGLSMDFEKAGIDVSQIGKDFLNESNS